MSKKGDNCKRKFAIFIAMLTLPFAFILYIISAYLGFIASILTIGLLSIVLRMVVDTYGDRMLTDSSIYMNSKQVKKFGEEKFNI